ncbi:MAG: hypothetical protein PHW76_08655 [Alphaproteobacteria bacterium]|nr:hypothetical protein [Alphaproteobacteria bacterium]
MSEGSAFQYNGLPGDFSLKPQKIVKVPREFIIGKDYGGDGIFGGLWDSPRGQYRVFFRGVDLKIPGENPKEWLSDITFSKAVIEVTTRKVCGHTYARHKTAEEQLDDFDKPKCVGRWSIPTIDVLELVAKNLFEENIAPSSLGLKGTYLSFTEDPENRTENILAVTFRDGVEPETISIPKANRVHLRAMRFVKCVTNG